MTQQFFEDLDRFLPSERGPAGEPSTHDFLVHELLRTTELFATEWDVLAEVFPGNPDFRIFMSVGLLVPRFAVVGQLVSNGEIELIRVYFDLDADWA